MHRTLNTLDQMSSAQGEEVLPLDRRGHIEHRSPGADALLRRFFDESEERSSLPREITDWMEESRSVPVAWPLLRRRETSRSVVRRMRIGISDALCSPSPRPTAQSHTFAGPGSPPARRRWLR